MPHVHFVLPDGTPRAVECAAGLSLMQAASREGLPGIEACCGGFCNCATCHVYVDETWLDRLPPIEENEDVMLDGTAAERQPNSRLACQINVTPELDGIAVRMPDRQA